MTPALKPAVEQEIQAIRAAFPGVEVTVREDGQGGAYVTVEEVELGDPYQQASTWVGFRLVFQCPYADVYPHYVRGDLSRIDGRALGEAMSQTKWEDRTAVQISRRSNHRDPQKDSALLKLLRILEWLRNRP